MNTTAAEHRTKAAEYAANIAESFDRCDTDGWATQAAMSIHRRLELLKAELAEQGGMWKFSALFDLDGNLVPAKLIRGRYGLAWALLATDDPRGDITGWFNQSKAHNPDNFRRNNAMKGFYVGWVMAPARALISDGGATGYGGLINTDAIVIRRDGGFSRDVEIIDNGH